MVDNSRSARAISGVTTADVNLEPLRLGILGAARITDLAVVKPAKITGTRLVAVAARDPARAAEFARLHNISRVHDSYIDVINDPDVEVVYNPLPNSLHAPWNQAALAAGKHVFTEKPSASNAAEAAEVAAQVSGTEQQFFEGFHYLWHPLIARLHAILASGELGELRHVETVMDMPAPDPADPRWSLALSGGALMDLGCYSLHSMRMLAPFAGGEPTLISARGSERKGRRDVDECVSAQLQFPNGVTGAAGCNMASDHHQMSHRLIGTGGQAVITDFVNPHNDDRLIVTTKAGVRTEHLGRRSSYTYQLEALTQAIRTGVPARTDAVDAVKTMRLIDECYQTIGMPARPNSAAVATM